MRDATARRFAFRVDASPQIGTGHVMRCLSLADTLRAVGGESRFLCRELPASMHDRIQGAGHSVHRLHSTSGIPSPIDASPAHAAWLGADWPTDASECVEILKPMHPDWLVVDHYGVDRRWEAFVRPHCEAIAVIDDLADRPHDCDLLLDQTLGRSPQEYQQLVPAGCTVMAGAAHALLRPEFAQMRAHSLARRRAGGSVRHLLVSMGGVDAGNATGRVLDALAHCSLHAACRITVVMGAAAPALQSVREQAIGLPWSTEVLVEVTDMAKRLSETDLSIGAAGTTAWERCCLGVPALMLVLARNQYANAAALEAAGAAVVLREADQSPKRIALALEEILKDDRLQAMSQAASRVTDGLGLQTLTRRLSAAS